MECATAILGLLVLVLAPLAVGAFLRSRANSAALARVEAELARLRELLARVAPQGATPTAPPPGWQATAAAEAPSVPSEASGLAAAAGEPGRPAQPVEPTTAGAPAQPPTPATEPTPAAEPSAPLVPAAAAGAAGPLRAARHASVEELVGARLLLWVGATALALAGAFLVKISFERGWISPPVRVAMGVAFGVALLALAEALRRSSGRISEALAAAGIADLFACFLAAVHLYRLVPPGVGFALMALTTAVAVALALRQGIMVALIGLVGGFLTPALIQTEHPSARNLFGYLLLLTAGLLAAAWRRGWRWLAFAALAGGLLWTAVWLAGPYRGGDELWLSLFLIALAVTATLPPIAAAPPFPIPASTTVGATGRAAAQAAAQAPAPAGAATPPGWFERPATVLAIAAALALLAATVSRSGYSTAEWGFLGLLAAGVLVLAWLDPRYLALAWVAGVTAAALLGAWGQALTAADGWRFLGTALAGGALFALAGWAAALAGRPRWRRPPNWLGTDAAYRPGSWAALSAAAGVVFFLVAWSSAREVAGLRSATWGGIALAVAALYLAGAVPVARRRRARSELGPALAALAVAVTTLVSVAVPLALERESLAVAWALEVLALVWLAGRFRLPVLIALARLLAVAAVFGTFFSEAQERARGELPLINELLYAYGVPLVALAAAAWLARRGGPRPATPGEWKAAAAAGLAGEDDSRFAAESPRVVTAAGALRLAAELEWEAVAVGFALLTLEVHQLFQPAVPPLHGSVKTSLAEAAAMASAWLLLGWALLWANRRAGLRSLELAGRLVIVAGLAAALCGPGVGLNPLWDHQPVGSTALLNLLAAAYALPAVLALAAAAEVRRQGGRRLPLAASVAALVLGFACISLEVRQLFHGTYLDQGAASAAERYAYSAAWVLYGLGLLLAGIARRGPILRYGSLAVMLLAVLKVFLYDTARLSDLYRVLSFLGLGASLLLLAFLYQRFVFREERA
jgi:uncharacterized membrane protein